MTTLRQAAIAVIDRWDAPMGSDLPDIGNCMDDLRTALESPEQEPVAWSVTVGDKFANCIEITHCKEDAIAQYETSTEGGFESIYTLHKLYAAPVEAPDIEALTKERDALRSELARPESTIVSIMRAERDALMAAAKIALAALEDATDYTSCRAWSPSMTEQCQVAITALKEAGVS